MLSYFVKVFRPYKPQYLLTEAEYSMCTSLLNKLCIICLLFSLSGIRDYWCAVLVWVLFYFSLPWLYECSCLCVSVISSDLHAFIVLVNKEDLCLLCDRPVFLRTGASQELSLWRLLYIVRTSWQIITGIMQTPVKNPVPSTTDYDGIDYTDSQVSMVKSMLNCH